MSDGDPCPRCGSTNTTVMPDWDDVTLVCGDCRYGT